MPEPNRTPRGVIAILVILVLGLIGLLLEPYVSFGVGFAILILEVAVVLPLVVWSIKWLVIQSLRRREEESLRRGDTFGAAEARAERERYERLGQWW
jgi:hypothetical protein